MGKDVEVKPSPSEQSQFSWQSIAAGQVLGFICKATYIRINVLI